MEAAPSKKRFWKRKGFLYSVGILFALVIVVSALGDDSKPQVEAEAAKSGENTVLISEEQCLALKDLFYSVIIEQPYEKTQISKELLEQYAYDGGIPVKRSNPDVRYVLPKSDCGTNLDTALHTIVEGEKKALAQ